MSGANKGSPLALPLSFETHELSTGYSSIVYDAFGDAVDTHLSEQQAETIVEAVNAYSGNAELIKQMAGALQFILAFYEPGQAYLDTNAWKQAEAGGRRAMQAVKDAGYWS